jgi:predicted hotdog family 3-hydroxylacyl-ACP dehydratase
MLTRAEICARLPHAGSMCLLDELVRWDAQQLEARAVSHRNPANPLRREGMLSALTGIEYAAQAVALHGSLLAGHDAPRAGFLASVRDVHCDTERLDSCDAPLDIRVERLGGDADGMIYHFAIQSGGQPLLRGRLTIRLMPGVGS